MIAVLSLSWVVSSSLQVGVMGDPFAVKSAVRELSSQGFNVDECAQPMTCVDDDACRAKLIASCDVDAVVGVEVRTESDGTWRRTVVIDRDGALALSLDQPADEKGLVPAIALETLRALRARTRERVAVVDEPIRITDAERRVEERVEERVGGGGTSPMFWAGVVASGVGVVGAATATTFAALAEATRAEPTAPAEARADAEARARLLWLGAATGAVVAVGGAVAACANSDTRTVAPEHRKWCIE